MATNLVAPDSPLTPAQLASPLYDQITPFYGNQLRFLLAALKHPGQTTMWLATQAGITDTTVYRWANEKPAFANVWKQIQSCSDELRSTYAKAAFLEATPDIADAMISRAKGDRKDAQRAGERILETVGVLPKGSAELPSAPVQVVTHTYVLVQRELGPQGTVVEGQTRELPPRPQAPV